jgi:hypothetical protein
MESASRVHWHLLDVLKLNTSVTNITLGWNGIGTSVYRLTISKRYVLSLLLS